MRNVSLREKISYIKHSALRREGIGLTKKFIQKPKRTFWPTQYLETIVNWVQWEELCSKNGFQAYVLLLPYIINEKVRLNYL